jgi:feruloyl-CoA synthase
LEAFGAVIKQILIRASRSQICRRAWIDEDTMRAEYGFIDSAGLHRLSAAPKCCILFRVAKFLAARVDVERRENGTLILKSPEPLGAYPNSVGEFLERWAERTPNALFLAQRQGGGWRKLTYSETRNRVRAIASSLLRRGLGREHPIAILSDNSIEHALITLAAMHAGIPVAPISPAYSLMSKEFGKLRAIFGLIEPALVFADDGARFEAALSAVSRHPFEVVVCRNPDAIPRGATAFDSLIGKEDGAAVERAFAAVGPETVAKLLMTSGSTGHPKAVINTQRMLCSNQQAFRQMWRFLQDQPPVLVEWLPWNHTFGGNNNFNAVLANGGSFYIDEGKPAPGLIETTVRNLREISPTMYFNVPRGYDLLIPYLEADETLRRTFFARQNLIMYAAAALPSNLWERLYKLAFDAEGRRIPLVSGWGSTETAPGATMVHFESIRPSVIGLPHPGTELKMVPVSDDGKYELRVRGPNVTPGYLKRPDLTADAFDSEGFYKIGDAGRLADPDDPAKGIEFAGRLAEDFKLTSGTWVHVGPLRVQAIEALQPVAQDIVIAGHDRSEVGLLIFPSAAFRDRTGEAGIREVVRAGLARLRELNGGASSATAGRALFLHEPPSIDAGEITDKAYINQRAVIERRAELVERLFAEMPADEVICL